MSQGVIPGGIEIKYDGKELLYKRVELQEKGVGVVLESVLNFHASLIWNPNGTNPDNQTISPQ